MFTAAKPGRCSLCFINEMGSGLRPALPGSGVLLLENERGAGLIAGRGWRESIQRRGSLILNRIWVRIFEWLGAIHPPLPGYVNLSQISRCLLSVCPFRVLNSVPLK